MIVSTGTGLQRVACGGGVIRPVEFVRLFDLQWEVTEELSRVVRHHGAYVMRVVLVMMMMMIIARMRLRFEEKAISACPVPQMHRK